MHTILVMNPKGGSGKTTLSTNIAGYFASWGVKVSIADFDPQESALDWLAARPPELAKINGFAVSGAVFQPPAGTEYLILDVPSGLNGDKLLPWVHRADRIVMPVLPSPHDIRAAKRFLDWLATDERLENDVPSFAIVANRVRRTTRSFQTLKTFLETSPVPCVGILRDTQNYVLAAQNGLSIFELPLYRAKADLEQWQRLVKWLCLDPRFFE